MKGKEQSKIPAKETTAKEQSGVGNDQNTRAETILLELLRESPLPHFSRREITASVYAQTVRSRLGLPRGDQSNLGPIMGHAARTLNQRLRSFTISTDGAAWTCSRSEFDFKLAEGAEWNDALREAWQGESPHSECYLSKAAAELLKLVESNKFSERKELGAIICRQIGIPVRENLETHLEEIVIKSQKALKWEASGSRWDANRDFKIWIEPSSKYLTERAVGLNPVLNIDSENIPERTLMRFQLLFTA